MVVTEKEKNAVVNAIRVLRSRRVRPSGQKIAWHLKRNNLCDEEGTVELLDELVRSSDILRVEYKGAISYRVVGSRATRSRSKCTLDGYTVRKTILSVVEACGSASRHRIAATLQEMDLGKVVDRLDVILQREVRRGDLIKSTAEKDGKLITVYAVAKSKEDSATSCDSESPDNSDEPTPSPFQHLHSHLKSLKKYDKESEGPVGNGKEKNAVESEVSDNESEKSKSDNTKSEDNSELSTESNSSSPPKDEISNLPPDVPNESVIHDDKKSDMKHISHLGSDNQNSHSSDGSYKKLLEVGQDYKQLLEVEPIKKTGKRGRPRKNGNEASKSENLKRPPSNRTKKRRKVFDPSDSKLNKKRRSNENQGGQGSKLCTFCNQNNDQALLECNKCPIKVHTFCAGYGEELASKILHKPWTCMDCKKCSICQFNHKVGTLIFCDKCDRAFHLTCHVPSLSDFPVGNWICFICTGVKPGHVYESIIPYLPKPCTPDSSCSSESEVVNVIDWDVESVYEHFNKLGFEEHSSVLKEQGIDGEALLVLSRSDIVQGLGLKLGPALRIYKEIRILQTRMKNPPL